MDQNFLYRFLSDNGIDYQRFDHPPVYTVEDVHRLTPDLPGAKTKNLFFRDKKGLRHFIVVVPADSRVDMKALAGVLESTRIRFGSPDRLRKYLGVDPGSVSLLAIINDTDKAVEVFTDETLWRSDAFQFHPLVNRSTLVISREDIEKFLSATGHAYRIVRVPGN